MLVNVALAVRMWSPQLTPPKQIHIILFIYLFFFGEKRVQILSTD